MHYLKLAGWAYLIIWALLLMHWIRCRSFYPLFKNHRWTKVFWGLTFLLFNPLLSLLYLIFGVMHRPLSRDPRHLLRARIIAFGLSAVVIMLCELPVGGPLNDIRILRKNDHNPPTTSGFKATTCESKINASSFSATTRPQNALFNIRRIAILNDSDHPLMIKTAHLLQQALIDLPMVDEVEYYPLGAAPKTGAQLPAYYLRLDMPEFKQSFRPAGRVVEAVVTCSGNPLGGNRHLHFTYNFDIPLIRHSENITVNYQGKTTGLESRSAVYDDEAKAISKHITDQLTKTFSKIAGDTDILPRVPNDFYGPYAPTPKMPFEQNHEVVRKISGCGLLVHNLTIWNYRDKRPSHEALQAAKTALETEGWKGSDDYLKTDYPTPLELRRNGERLILIRRTQPESLGMQKQEQSDIIAACYLRPFTKKEILQAANQLLESPDTDIKLLLAFSHDYQTGDKNTGLLQRYESRLLAATPSSVETCLAIARIWKSRNNPHRAMDMLARAVALDHLQPSQTGSNQQEMKKLGKELGVEKIENMPITDKMLQAIGLIPVTLAPTNITRTVKLNEPFGFYAHDATADVTMSKNALKTCVFKVIQDATADPSGRIPKQDPRSRWKLSMVTRGPISSTWTSHYGQLENGHWTIQDEGWADHLSPNHRIDVKARETDDGRISFSAVIGN